MYTHKKLLLSISIALCFILTNCSPEEIKDRIEDEFGGTDGTDFVAKVNGKQFGASLENVHAYITVTENVYTVAIGAGAVEGLTLGKAIAIAFSGSDYDELNAGSTHNSTEGQYPAGAGYEEHYTDSNEDYETDEVESIYIKVTAIDKSNLTISGEFNFTAIDEDTNTTYTVTDGKFTNIPYEIIQ